MPAAEPVDVDHIAADPTAIPPPVDWDEPRTHELSKEMLGVIDVRGDPDPEIYDETP